MKHHRLFAVVRTGILLIVIGGGSARSQQAPPPASPVPAAIPQRTPSPSTPGSVVPGTVRPGIPVPGVSQPGIPVPGASPSVPTGQPRPPSAPGGVPGGPPQPVLTQGDYSYVISYFNEATIVGFNKDFKGALTMIDTLGGCPVSGIARAAFSNTTGLTRVTVPASVTKIETRAFSDCKGLTALTVDASNKTFSSLDGVLFNKEQSTLIHCPVGKSGSYKIPGGVTQVADQAFMGCSGLTSVTIPDTTTQIGYSTFYGCSGLKDIAVDQANKTYSSLEGVLFNKDQTSLVLCPAAKTGDYAIPAKVTRIDSSSLTACNGLARITIPESLITLGGWDFWDCCGVSAIDVDRANKAYSSVEGVLFNKDQTRLVRCPPGKTGGFVIPPGVTTIGRYAFSNCNGLTQLTIPESVTSVELQAFQNCNNLSATIKALGRISFNAPSYPAPTGIPQKSDPAAATSPGASPATPRMVPTPTGLIRQPRTRVVSPTTTSGSATTTPSTSRGRSR